MVQHIVACQYKHKSYIIKEGNEKVNRRLELLKINDKYGWYDDVNYASMIPFRKQWFSYNYIFWWDIFDTKCQLQVQDTVQTMEVVFKKDRYVVSWLKHWASKGAYFILVGQ